MSSIVIYRGADWSVSCSWTDEAGDPVDATGAAVSASIRRMSSGVEVVAPVAVWTDIGEGQFKLSLDEAGTADIPEGLLSELRITIVTTGGDTHKFPSAPVLGA